MRSTQVIIRTDSGIKESLSAAHMLVLANPLYPAAELLEKELADRGLLIPDKDLILWDITALKNEPLATPQVGHSNLIMNNTLLLS